MNTPKDQKRNIIRLLRSHGITPTAQRVKIAAAILEKPQHLTADQVLLLVNQEGKRVSKATIYNTLGLFSEKGLIKQLNVHADRAFYDSTTHNHHHFFNHETQELTDIQDGDIAIKLPENLPPETEIRQVDMVVHLGKKSDD